MIQKVAIVIFLGVFFLEGFGYSLDDAGNLTDELGQSAGASTEIVTLPSIHLAAASDTEKNEKNSGKGSAAKQQPKKDASKSSKQKAKPLKPFVPSEKIKADQAVDFPYDI